MMKQTLTQIKKVCEFQQTPRFVKHLHGGDINKVYLIEADHQPWVVKQNDAKRFPKMLEKEFRAMQFLRDKSPLYYPKMVQHFEHEQQQFLIMEYVEENANSKIGQQELGKRLAQQHLISNDSFGWQEDNFIGSLKQVNTYENSWTNFFAEHRLLYQTKMAYDSGLLNTKDIQQTEKLCNQLNEIIPTESPALLHGDLWSGNYFISQKNKPVLYDPAVYFGHREIDIAMTQLFGGFSKVFIKAYQDENPLEKNWEERIDIFQLYPNLVHLNLFGRGYASSVQSVIARF